MMLSSYKLKAIKLGTSPMHVKGRKGMPSILDTIVCVLDEQTKLGEPSMSLSAIRQAVEERMGYPVASSSVRSVIYKSEDVFTQDKKVGKAVFYRLSSRQAEVSS